jgi:hypothetical protein
VSKRSQRFNAQSVPNGRRFWRPGKTAALLSLSGLVLLGHAPFEITILKVSDARHATTELMWQQSKRSNQAMPTFSRSFLSAR